VATLITVDAPTRTLSPVSLPGVPSQDPTGSVRKVQAGAAELSSAVAEIRLDQQITRNTERVFTAETALGSEYMAFETDLLQRRQGANAKGVTQEVEDWWKKQGAAAANQLENDAQRKVFSQTVARSRLQGLTTASKFEAVQTRKALDDAAQSAVDLAIANAASHFSDAVIVSGARDSVVTRIDVVAERNGWAPETIKAKKLAATTMLHRQVLENMVDSNPEGARKYFKANSKEVDGKQHDEIEAFLKTGALKERSQTVLDTIVAKDLSQRDADVEVKKEKDAEVRAAAQSLVDQHYARQEQIRAREEAAAKRAAVQIMTDTNGDWTKIPAALNIPFDFRKALQAQVPLVSHPEASAELAQLSPRGVADSNPADFKYRLSESDYAVYEKTWTEVRSGKLDTYTLEKQISDAQLVIDDDASDDKEEKALFAREVRTRITFEQEAKGRQLLQDERQSIIDLMLFETKVGTNRRFFEIAASPVAVREFIRDVDVPSGFKIQYLKALSKAGRSTVVSDRDVLEQYVHELRRRGELDF